jgi:hypothetical protein
VFVNKEGRIFYRFCLFSFDGKAKSPSAVLRVIFRHYDVPEVRLTPQDLRALHLELFALPSA